MERLRRGVRPSARDHPGAGLGQRRPDGLTRGAVAGRSAGSHRTSVAPVRGLLRHDHQEHVLFQIHHDLRRDTLAATGRRELLRRPTASRAPCGELFKHGATHGPPPVVLPAARSNDVRPYPLRLRGRRPRTRGPPPAAVRGCVRPTASPQTCLRGRVLRASHRGLRKRGNRDRLDQRSHDLTFSRACNAAISRHWLCTFVRAPSWWSSPDHPYGPIGYIVPGPADATGSVFSAKSGPFCPAQKPKQGVPSGKQSGIARSGTPAEFLLSSASMDSRVCTASGVSQGLVVTAVLQ